MSATNRLKRITRLEDKSLDDEPPVKTNIIFTQIDGTAVMDGVRYLSTAQAVAAVPHGEEHIVGRVVDGRKTSTESKEL